MKKFLFCAVLTLACAFCASAQNAGTVMLKAGTPVNLKSVSALNSKYLNEGSSVDFIVSNDIVAEGVVVVPSGSVVKGYVMDARRATVFGIGGEFYIAIDGLYANDGTYIPLTGASISASGDDNIVLAVACGLFTVLGFLINGEQAVLPSNTPVQGIVMVNTYITY
ncbi:MAG: hypothetical protein ACI3ZF_04870 [Candidatus Cryptobacteroides sp.]